MNFLAHIYLSGNNDLIKIGNFMADGIRGNEYKNFNPEIQKGILLHRAIDTFTDAHPVFRKSKHRLHEAYGHYSGVIIDVFYDHFLAKNWQVYADVELEKYVAAFYNSLEVHYDELTEKTKGLMPYMIGRNWLVSYATIEGIGTILFQMDHRTKNRSGMQNSVKELQEFYTDFEKEFTLFFEELRHFAATKLTQINHDFHN
ncbi:MULTISPECIES: acyl carrier protein phosphodiesterase [unclassified Flavobacterium]|uniref:acyl carrier protein phosphodiesterase n=1 Tax=unclassified Flavobacterium TaxID=196869 RepID=UPI00086C565B|nr:MULTISPECIES: acyl carrier protein phosphodiesterase [unclassified Flavobacterium]MBN9283842.1 acyl carrier protein phosphodiesterase [Flavobacterium sp.]ODS80675.1 MAG: ACP phosphodiesterase [Chryseobacterium sp. SCN 40-13]OJV68656.1 MAG: ACP phosphodiesterase [Flavobacterium sp. 40-81]